MSILLSSKKAYFFIKIFLLFNAYNLFSQNLVVSKILLKGNNKTKSFVILNELPISVGDTIQIKDLKTIKNEIKNNVFNTSLFNYVTVNDSIINNNKIIFIINVVERWYIWPYPILEHADINFSSFLFNQNWSKINYGLMTVLYNLRGRRDFLKIKFRKGYKEQYGITYYNPYLNKKNTFLYSFEINKNIRHEYPIGIKNLKFDYYKNDTLKVFDNNFGKFTIIYRKNLYTFISFSSYFSQTTYLINSQTKQQTLIFKPSISYNIDKRDIHYYSLKGYYINIKSSYAKVFSDSSNDFVSFTLDFRKYLPINKKVNFSFRTFLNPFVDNFRNDYNSYVKNHIRATDFLVYPTNFSIQTSLKYNIMPQKDFVLKFIPFEKINRPFLSIYSGLFSDVAIIPKKFLQERILYSAGFFIDFVTYYDKVLRIEIGANSLSNIGLYINFLSAF